MVRLTEVIPRLQAALTAARDSEIVRIEEALRRFGMTGVHGEPEVGVTRLIAETIRASGQPSIRVDLDGATDEAYVAWVMARELAVAVIGRTNLSLMHAPIGLRPTSAIQDFIDLTEQVGKPIAELATGELPNPDIKVGAVLEALGRVYEHAAAPPVLWIDHLQAPRLTPRHPLDVSELLWSVRALQQRIELPIILSGNRVATAIAHETQGAFHGDGVWLEIGRPDVETWIATSSALTDDRSRPAVWVTEMAEMTRRHPSTMLLALALAFEGLAGPTSSQRGDAPPRLEREVGLLSPLEMWQFMLSLDDGHTGRSMQHARTLHRLGGHVLEQIAHGAGPYTSRKGASIQEIHRAVRRLHEAGLITQPAERQWEVTNPLVAARLRSNLPLTTRDAIGVLAHEPGSSPVLI